MFDAVALLTTTPATAACVKTLPVRDLATPARAVRAGRGAGAHRDRFC
jgi:hypothetical protein